MFISFFESIKYVGHLYPVALLRIYLGYYFLSVGIEHIQNEFLVQPRLAAQIMNHLPEKTLPAWYAESIQTLIVPNWQVFAYILVYSQIVIGVALILGFLVRPICLLAMFLSLNAVLLGSPAAALQNQIFLVLFITLYWVGAGRCLGVDYYFYKRQRGIWW